MLDQVETAAQNENTQEEMKELYENFMGTLQGSNILKGKVINVNNDSVIIDVGLKSEGKAPITEFTDRSGEVAVNVGDEVEVMIVGREKSFGLLLLSKQKVDLIKTWNRINKAFEEGTPIEGDIISEVKGGFLVDIGINAFLPISQVDSRPVKNPSAFVGRHLKFKVIKVNQRKDNVIVSRRSFLEEEKERKRQEFWKTAKKDQVIYGLVRNITDYGAFIDLGGVDGFLYLNEITWGKISHPKEYLRIGDEVKVKVIDLDPEKERVSVSIKQLKPDPWLKIDERYQIGTKVKGRVVAVVDYGAFVELEHGVEGLLHISEMSWDRKMKSPGKIVKKGDWLELVVLGVDVEKRRISLGLKQLLPDPWEELAEKSPPGSVVKGKVKNLTDFGLFIGIGDGIDGLVHLSEISWSRRKDAAAKIYKKGTTVEALVLNVDKEHKRFSLSLKQMKKNPWEGLSERYHVGDIVEGYVTSITDFGVFVEIEDGVEGLVHVSELDEQKGKHPSELFKIDDKVRVIILNIDEREKRIGLSIKALKRQEDEKGMEALSKDGGALSTFRDVLEPLMMQDNETNNKTNDDI